MEQEFATQYTVSTTCTLEVRNYDDPHSAAKAFHAIPATDKPLVILTSLRGARVVASSSRKIENGAELFWKYASMHDVLFHSAYMAIVEGEQQMVDFKKMLDPAWQKEYAEIRAREDAAAEEKEVRIKSAIDLFSGGDAFSRLTEKEQGFINSCEKSLRYCKPLTEKQEIWLCDLATRDRQYDGDDGGTPSPR